MEELLRELVGRKIDVRCGGTESFTGEVSEIKKGVVYLRDEDEKIIYLAIEKISAINESTESPLRPGFIG